MVRTVRTADPRVRNDSGHFRFTASRSYPPQAHSGHTGSRSVHFTPRTDDCRDRVTIFDTVQPLVHHGLINRTRFLRYEILLQTIKPAAGSKRRRSATFRFDLRPCSSRRRGKGQSSRLTRGFWFHLVNSDIQSLEWGGACYARTTGSHTPPMNRAGSKCTSYLPAEAEASGKSLAVAVSSPYGGAMGKRFSI